MISTKSLIANCSDIPREWVFEFYLQLGDKLVGQDINVKSPFSVDRKPSLYVYFSSKYKSYQYKDFSTGKCGDGVALVKELYNLPAKADAALKVIRDYNKYLLTNQKEDYTLRAFRVRQRYKVMEPEVRPWTTADQRYWTAFHIGSKLLESYNVKPLAQYTLFKEEDGELKSLVIKGNYIYGFHRKDGGLYKIYQPLVKDNKFIKIQDYVQGVDQLTMTKPYLVICSSLKDIMAFNRLGYTNAEAVAPDSENCLLPSHIMSLFKLKYKGICSLYDNDDAGIASMKKLKEREGIPYVILELSKDISDSIRDHGICHVREVLTPLLKSVLNEKTT